MTNNRARTRAIRARMATTGETYTQAMRAIDNIHDLIERSTLGTPGAKAARDSVPTEVAAEVVRRSREGH